MYNTWRESDGQQPFGLYQPSMERDACGVGFIVSIDGKESAKILRDSEILCRRMIHRGARAGDNDTGDGAGVLTAIPQTFFAYKVKELHGVDLPPVGQYATGLLFMSEGHKDSAKTHFEQIAERHGLKVICWRHVPGNNSCLGKVAKDAEPYIEQPFVEGPYEGEEFQRKIFMLRKQATHQVPVTDSNFYICSLSTSIIVYKGLFTSEQLWEYFIDLTDPEYETYLALVHTRFSTNTFPSWDRAHPLRYLAHNGEINTLRGNVNLMKAREGVMHTGEYGEDLKTLYPVVEPNLSDSGCVDCVLEFLVMAGGRSLPEAVMTMVPEAWQNDDIMNEEKKDFYRWAACAMEPWDGPALLTFTDGRYVGAILDRNGLRPSRYYITSDNIMVMASEVGVYDCPHQNIIQKGRLKPGRMLLVDTKEKVVTRDEELKLQIARSRPHTEWLKQQITLSDLREAHGPRKTSGEIEIHVPSQKSMDIEPHWQREPSSRSFDRRLAMFGYTTETIAMLLVPMVTTKKEALGSMGNDAPLSCLSDFQPLPYSYFKQLFAQVTNPPIDPFRERVVMSLACPIGPAANILEPSAEQCKRLFLENPILSLEDLYVLKRTSLHGWKPMVIDMTYPLEDGIEGLMKTINRVCEEAREAAEGGYQFLVLSDRLAGPQRVAVSALLILGAVHHHLIEERQRMKVALLLETGEAREVHQMCVLLGFGADAICPYLVFETMTALREEGVIECHYSDRLIYENFCAAMERGIAKVMAKMGISTLQSYKGAQIFEAVGISKDVINKCFKGTASRIGGVTFDIFAGDALDRHYIAYDTTQCDTYTLRNPGQYHWRAGGEKHINDPEAIANLQNAVRNKVQNAYEKYRDTTMETLKQCTLRGQLEFVDHCTPIPLSEVEPASEIVKRFATGAMSFGSISLEAHTTLAVAMNRVGGKSNTGEGGEDSDRFIVDDPEFNRRSAIKQVASGRFGVTINYLANANELQIKMAQGAKPGEGGELPGYKVTEDIAKTRHSVPGVGLISPPPHHDIYSIEDLAELIYDLKCSNPKARISVKLVSEVGVGVVASGVAKGKAEHITISGHDGGTGASSWTGIKHSGLPWELGISETHQVLVMNDLRSRVVLQADGQMRTGFDIVVGALLGADEFGMSTAPLIVMGCTMMRKCHLNTCPVGVATQDPVLRKKFEGKPEHVINFLFMLAEEARGYMAKLGIRKFGDLIGRSDLLKVRSDVSSKVKLLDFSAILESANKKWPHINIRGGSVPQDFELEKRLDVQLIQQSMPVLQKKEKSVTIEMNIHNECRTFGATLSHEIASRFGDAGLPEHSINIQLKGSAGQSFCAFMSRGVKVTLEGDANDYVGKCLSGGEIMIYPPRELPPEYETHKNIIAGNVCLYGATSGKAYFRGMVAERFCVRNSGAIAVCEGCGDHGCEYMTGGRALILGLTGRNFAAGMSGGIAYVWDVDGSFRGKCNMSMVELHPLEELDDLEWVESLLQDFYDKTGSMVASNLLQDWPDASVQFLKVFPLEYQKALKQIAVKQCTLRLQAGGGTDSAPGSLLPSPYDEERTPVKSVPKAPPPPAIKDIEDAIQGAQKTKKLDKPRGFMKYFREMQPYRDAETRQEDWDEIYNFKHVRSGLRKQAARCMECGVPFCQSANGCPLGNIIPKWNDLVFNNDWKEALDTLLQTNNFPEFTGRVCPAPCEGACVLGISEPAVTIKNIECSIIDYGFEQGWIQGEGPAVRTGKKVAIVGGGPSGMACAHQLNKAGHLVTVYERNDRIGGLLQYGIPTMKLSKDVVQRRVRVMQKEGIIFKTGVHVGKNQSAKEIKDEHDALVLCLGSTWPRDLPIHGRQLSGIHFAMEFLETWQKKQMGNEIDHLKLNAKDKDVVVIGGGDTGCDCIATSLRQGAKSITTFEILPPPPPSRASDNPWPQWPKIFRVDYGHEEVKVKWGNDPRMFNTLSKEFLDDGNGNVSGIKTVEVSWAKDPSGRWQMKELPDSEKIIKADLVLLAMGFLGPEKEIIKELLLQQDPRSNIQTPQGKYCTSVPGVFAAGDCRRGQSLVVWAISEGRQAARDVDLYLYGKSRLSGAGGIIQYGHFPNPKG